jgi:hypothetical protein
MMDADPYLEPHQTRSRPPTAYENLLGDALERAFAGGAGDLQQVAAALNRSGPPRLDSLPWTPENLQAELARLSAA